MTSLNGDRYADIGYHGEQAGQPKSYEEVVADKEAIAQRARRYRAALRWIRDYPGIPLAVLAKANEALIGRDTESPGLEGAGDAAASPSGTPAHPGPQPVGERPPQEMSE